MLNGDLKKNAIAKFEKAKDRYENLVKDVGKNSEKLMDLRKEHVQNIINHAENLLSNIGNKPAYFDKAFSDYKHEFKAFSKILNTIKQNSKDVDFKAGSLAGAGAATGAGVAAFGPTAAMAIATTFGTASTGTAISALGGAAATNAALAWLGGGALAAGGGGMAAGNALLALSGPIGWAIGGVALVGGGLFARSKNAKIAKEADEKRREVEVLNSQFSTANIEIKRLISETIEHSNSIVEIINHYNSKPFSGNFDKMSDEQKKLLIVIINNVKSLTQLIKKKVEL